MMAGSLTKFEIIKFKGANLELWKLMMQAMLVKHECDMVFDHKEKKPALTKHEALAKQDNMTM